MFEVRMLAALSKRIRGDLRRELPGSDATVWPNNLAVLSKVFAAALHEVDLRMGWLYRQIFVSTADQRHLERHAYEYGLSRKPAARSAGQIETTGTPGTVYPAGIVFYSGADGFVTGGDARAADNGVVRFAIASDKRGAARNRPDGETLTLADPALWPSIGAQASVINGGLGGGADIETDESLRARVLDRKRRPPQGGAYSDYEQMARAVPGVVKAWAWPFAGGPGTVGVWFLFEGRENFIPDAADVAAVKSALDAKRLIRAGLSVSAPYPQAIDVTISGLAVDSQAVRDAISARLTEALYDRGRPGVAVEAFVLSRSWIAEAISSAVGEDRHRLVAPAADITLTGGSYPVLGTVTYV